MSTNAEYLAMQKKTYSDLATDRRSAQLAVHPRFDDAAREAYATLAYILTDVAQRRASFEGGADIDNIHRSLLHLSKDMSILDYGCGVGRLMEALVDCGYSPDGVDISPEMLEFARTSDILRPTPSRFYLSSGDNCGEAPLDHYDLAYSVLCFQHICVRSIRKSILASIQNCLKPDGVVCIQVQYFPEIGVSQIPEGHAGWIHDKNDATSSNSTHDVWLTADMLPNLIADFASYFSDLRLQFVNLPTTVFHDRNGSAGSFQHLFISGSKTPGLHQRIYRTKGR
jgi:SAM-dependent methyltransferase